MITDDTKIEIAGVKIKELEASEVQSEISVKLTQRWENDMDHARKDLKRPQEEKEQVRKLHGVLSNKIQTQLQAIKETLMKMAGTIRLSGEDLNSVLGAADHHL